MTIKPIVVFKNGSQLELPDNACAQIAKSLGAYLQRPTDRFVDVRFDDAGKNDKAIALDLEGLLYVIHGK